MRPDPRCEVHTFDHTVDAAWAPPPYLHYHRVGLRSRSMAGGAEAKAAEAAAGAPTLSLPEIIQRFGRRAPEK